jgi:hypothetical protein
LAEYLVCHSAEIVVLFASYVLALFIVIMMGLVCVEVEEALIGFMNLFSCRSELGQGFVDRASSTGSWSVVVQG